MQKLSLIFALFCICGCSSNSSYQEPTSDVADSSMVVDASGVFSCGAEESFDTMIESMEFIPLENSPSGIVSMVEVLQVSENYIYILDARSTVSIFDIKGSFVKQIGRGQGPEEISRARTMAFDKEKHFLYVYDEGQSKMMKFKEDGTFVGSAYSKDRIVMEDFAIICGHFVYVRPISPYGNCEQYVSVADTSLNVVATVSLGKANPRMGIRNYISETEDGCIISKPLSKEIFCHQNGKFFKKYILSDGIGDVPLTGTSSGIKGIEETMEAVKSAGDFVYMGDCWETLSYQGFLFVPCDGKSKSRYAIRNKATGKVRGCEYPRNSILNGLDYLLFAALKYDDDFLCTYFQPGFMSVQDSDIKWDGSNPGNLLSPADLELLKGLTSDDNPVIVIFKLRSGL